MILNHRTLLISLCSLLFAFPTAGLAQENHCVAQKSPLRMAFAAGQPIYAAKCQTCHQADGSGLSDANPSLIKSKAVSGDKQPLIELMIGGHQPSGEAGVKYSQTMPAYAEMNDDEIANVLTYIRRSFGNRASMVKTGEVKKTRAAIK